jgi:DNA-binding HxlR family transcriptional regulator
MSVMTIEDLDLKCEGLTKACPIEVTFKILGKRWTMPILREMFRGVTQFSRFHENIKGINPRMLSLRLRELQRSGMVKRRIVSEYPLRAEYELTELGLDVEKVLVEAALYSMRNFPKAVFKDGKPRGPEQLAKLR